jgi:long-subunit fatty acid transport protein
VRLAGHGKFTDKLGFDLGGKIVDWDFSSGNLATCKRNDLLYTVSSGLTYTVNAHISINLAGSLDWARNDENGVTHPQTREFDRQLISLGTQWKF